MSDDTTTNENVEQEVVEDEAPVEQEQGVEQEQVEDEPEAPEEPQQEEAPAEQPPSRREQLRIQQLLSKYGNPEERRAPSQNTQINYKDMIDADPEVYDQLQNASQQFGQQQYNQGLEEAKFLNWRTDLKIDTARVNQEHANLDPRSDDFNPALADSINQMYLRTVGYDGSRVSNPNISYADYVDSIFELADEAANRKVETTQRNITRQVARTGIRPDGSVAKSLDLSKAPSQMSDDELDAALASNGLTPKKRN